MTHRFNPELLQLAREANELTQSELADAIGISQGWYSKIEHGIEQASGDLVLKMSTRLNFPPSFFYLTDQLYGLPAGFHRKRKKLKQRALDRIHAEVNLVRIHLKRLLEPLELDEGIGIPELDPDQFGTPAQIARAVRETWNVPRGAIRNLVALIEDVGGVVLLVDFKARDIDGIGVRYAGLPPLFFLNSKAPTDRLRFTLAHELGHIVMHTAPREDMEAEADAFAAEFLLPEQDIRHQLGRVSFERLAALKQIWRVSMSSLLRRHRDLGVITDAAFKYWMMQFGRMGFRTREPAELDPAPEVPRLLAEMFQLYETELRYTINELAKALHVDIDRLQQMYPVRRDGLRLVG